MPLYEYRCRRCGKRFERLVRGMTTTDATGAVVAGQTPAIVCPECQSDEVERLLSAFARTAPSCAPAASGGG